MTIGLGDGGEMITGRISRLDRLDFPSPGRWRLQALALCLA